MNKKRQKTVYISLLNWNNYKECIKCIDTIILSEYKEYKIIIRDNCSKNNSFAILKNKYPQYIVVRSQQNNGYAQGHLENWEIAKQNNADFFWILNVDLTIDPKALNALVETYSKNGIGVYGSVSLKIHDKTIIDFAGGKRPEKDDTILSYNTYKNLNYEEYRKKFAYYREVQTTEGSSMFLPKEVIENFGFMKTDFFMYNEEVDYAFRLRSKGVKSFIVTNSIIFHKSEGSFKDSNRLYLIPLYYRRRNYLRFLREHFNYNFFQILNYKDSIIVKIKLLIKCMLLSEFKENNSESYFLTLATIHAAFKIKGKTLDPENFK